MLASRTLPKVITSKAKVGFFTPSDPILARRVKFVNQGLEILQEWGFDTEQVDEVKLGLWKDPQSPTEKAREIHRLISDQSVDVLMGTWGGKNTSDLLPLLDYDLIAKHRKIIIGHSDVAVILNAIAEKSNLITFYGPNVLGKLNQTQEFGLPLQNMKSLLGCDAFGFRKFGTQDVVREGKCEGQLFGGSLGTFTLGLSGTQYMPTSPSIIFFFESSSLDIFRLRQHLQHLKLTGFLDRVVGVVTGATEQITADNSDEFNELLEEFFPVGPIVRSNAFGHGFYLNPSIPIGANACLNLVGRPTCTLI